MSKYKQRKSNLNVQFSKQEEIEFLMGYVNLSPGARVLEIKALWQEAKNMKPSNERGLLYLLAVESFFMQQETLYKFLKATKAAANGKNFINVLIKTTFNPVQDMSNITSFEDLNLSSISKLTKPTKEKVIDRGSKIIKTCKLLAKANKEFSTLYHALKHGFLIYEKNGDLLPLMHKHKLQVLLKNLERFDKNVEESSIKSTDFSYLIDLNQRIAYTIQDLIVIRLIQLGITKVEN